MNVSLTTELESIVDQKVKSGMYNSASEVVREGLRLLQQRDEMRETKLNALRAEIQKGIEDLEAGRYRDGDEAMAEIKDRLVKRKLQNG
ncbi:MAG TPA: type II toxin-antitoxin system ParD family antitoxin [Pyrinomonadaceae bacterium]|nr:type II toxin-antitoxin system ParD family antitoxin [Pyrinomonadaceae bacterium]